MNTDIKIIKNVLADGVRFDLYIDRVPADFLGLAGDLKFGGTGVYLRTDLSETINALPFVQQPIKMVKADQDKLVMGLSFKANQLAQIPDGVLASFWFEGDKEFLGFEKEVFSVYRDGVRQDLLVNWSNDQQIVSATSREKVPVKVKNVADVSLETPLSAQLVETNLNQVDYQRMFAGEEQKVDSWLDISVFIIIGVLLAALGAIYLFNKIANKSRQSLPSLTSSGI
ncbi:hypothetical protein IT412_05435 [Candidatus Peregrinibacteria bacterium]|nr:hypothetical protein [Candidatus Peregrinibacteria bacterium]